MASSVGFLDRFLLPTTTTPAPDLLQRGQIEELIALAVSERQATFTMADALAMPPVARAVDLIASLGSSFGLIEYTGGTASSEQPRIVRRPDPFRTRQEYLSMLLLDIVTEGESYVLTGSRREGYPEYAMVIPHDEVEVEPDRRQFLPTYAWRGRRLILGQDILHLAINRRAGELHGHSVLRAALPYLATIDAAEAYAAASFGSGGVPQTVLEVVNKMTEDEAKKLKLAWATSRASSTITGEPAVISGGIKATFPGVNPQDMQLQAARSYGATTVARLLGIPAPLLHVETSGATITYTNELAAIDSFVKATLAPRYLAVIEQAMADLVPRTKTVRFNFNELLRADIATRATVYQTLIAAGVMTTEEARLSEGYPPAPPPINRFTQYEPTPALESDSSVIPASEVPARA